MSGEKAMKQVGAPLLYRLGAGARTVFLGAALFAITGCAVEEQKQEQAAAPPVPVKPSPQPAAPVESPRESEQAKIQETAPPLVIGTGHSVWAPGFEGELVLGLDGQLYYAYNEATIREVQSVMKKRGLYAGPVNGVLDPPTMESIYAFQEANKYMLRCGVPTPRTRKLLEQGSHTDIS